EGVDVGAVRSMHRDTATDRDEAFDRVPRDRVAALGETDKHVVQSLHGHPRAVDPPAPGYERHVLGVVFLGTMEAARPRSDGVARDGAVPDLDEHRVEVAVAEVDGYLGQEFVAFGLRQVRQLPAERLERLFLSFSERLVTALLEEPLLDLGTSAGRTHEGEPIPARPRVP